jgi:hypothetical protein
LRGSAFPDLDASPAVVEWHLAINWWKIQEIEIGKVIKALRNWPVLLICSSIKMAEWAAASNLHRQFSGQKIVTQTRCKPSKACAQTEKPSCELVIGK